MNTHYKEAVDGLKELPAKYGSPTSQAIVLATIQARATLAVAENLDALLKAQQTGNAIAYAQLCHSTRQGSKIIDAREQAEKLIAGEPGMAFATEDEDG